MADTVMTYRLVVKEIAYAERSSTRRSCRSRSWARTARACTCTSRCSPRTATRSSMPTIPRASTCRRSASTTSPACSSTRRSSARSPTRLVNSYKRLVPGYEAPVYITWARRNRSAMVRVPMYKPGKETATRVELRSPDPSANPYLAFAVMLGAGLKGIEEEPPARAGGHQQHLPHDRGRARGRRHQDPARGPGRGHRAVRA